MVEGAEYLIRTYDLPLTLRDYEPAMRQVIRDLYKKVELKPGVREMLARLKAEGVRMCICSNTWQSSAKKCSPGWASQTISSSSTPHRREEQSPPRGVPRSPRAAGRQRTRRRVVCEDAVYATRTARQCGFYLIDIEDETSAADQPELQRLADQYITDWTQLDWTKL